MMLERVGPTRFVADLREAGARLSTHRLVGMPSLPVALGGVGISLADLTMLYVDLANGGVAAPLIYAGAAPDTPARRLMSKTAAWYVGDILAGSSRPDGWGEGIGLTSTRTVAFKTGTSYGFRDAWAVGFSQAYTVGVWVGRADGSPRPGHFGRNTATPIMLKLFGLLPAEAPGWRPPPADALIVRGNEALPPALRHFTRAAEDSAPHRLPPPRILFPADGMLIETATSDPDIVLKAKGGRGDLYLDRQRQAARRGEARRRYVLAPGRRRLCAHRGGRRRRQPCRRAGAGEDHSIAARFSCRNRRTAGSASRPMARS